MKTNGEWSGPHLLPKKSGEYLVFCGWDRYSAFRKVAYFSKPLNKWHTSYNVYAWTELIDEPENLQALTTTDKI